MPDGLTSLAIPNSVTNISSTAFYSCNALMDKEWMPIAEGEKGNYNFFKVTVEMR
jgi:hypothetical protein